MVAGEIGKGWMGGGGTGVVVAGGAVGNFGGGMPKVYATAMMIKEMEMASGDEIKPQLQPGWITVGTQVDIRHLAASPVGAVIRTTARAIAGERRLIRFEVDAFDGERRISEGRHARGLVDRETFSKRFAATCPITPS